MGNGIASFLGRRTEEGPAAAAAAVIVRRGIGDRVAGSVWWWRIWPPGRTSPYGYTRAAAAVGPGATALNADENSTFMSCYMVILLPIGEVSR
jgi:hypothetical protein